MNSKTVKKILEPITGLLDKIVEPDIRAAVAILLNLVESLANENEELRQIIQDLRDEINILKGEQGKPKIRSQKNKEKDDHSSEDERNSRKKKTKKKTMDNKKEKIKSDRSVICEIDTSQLPPDAQRKGYKPIVIQDLKIVTDNIEFKREVYYSPSLKKTFIADLPRGYEGQFGPGIKVLVISLYHNSNMTQPALSDFFETFGIFISEGTISTMLTDKHEHFHQEKEDIFDAGLKAPYQQTDDTSGRVDGTNHHVHVFCNEFYMAFFTRPKKDRLTLLEILCRGELKFSLDQDAIELMETLGMSQRKLRQVGGIEKQSVFTRSEMDTILLDLFPNPEKQKTNRRIILEATALTYYHSLPHAVQHMMCDDAPQFNLIAKHKSLCWIHEGRHYKKLHPFVLDHKKLIDAFLTELWDYYQKLLDYTENPTALVAMELHDEFDRIFSTKTGYDELNARIGLTAAKKKSLLLVLEFPFLPLHNNNSEGGAQHQARLRDIHLQTRNEKGTKAKDTFATIVKTARKLNVNLYEYFYDRITKKFSMPSLADIILEKCQLCANTS
jgi:hypothetical protein